MRPPGQFYWKFVQKLSCSSLLYNSNKKIESDMEIPEPLDDCGPTIIYGVESENIEEINDAYGDMITDMGEICDNKT